MPLGQFVPALVKIPAPLLAAHVVDRADVILQQRKGQKKFQIPRNGLGNFRVHHFRQGRLDFDGLADLWRQFFELFKSARSAGWISNIKAKMRAAGVHLQVEIALVRFRLDEKLHATVLPDFILKIGSHRAHISILHLENAVDAFRIVEQLRRNFWAMRAAFRSKIRHCQCVRLLSQFFYGVLHKINGERDNRFQPLQ